MNFDDVFINEPEDELDYISNIIEKEEILGILGYDFDYMLDDAYYDIN